MTTNKPIAPSPDVQFLPTIFRRIQQGNIRMPAFQRGFVWKAPQVAELLRSIYSGFPIGSALLWKVDRREMRVDISRNSLFPDVPERYPTNYILDGLQRLSTLYSVFHFESSVHPRFNVSFDLVNEDFVSPDSANEAAIPLSILFKPNEFIQYHAKLSRLSNGELLVNRAVELLTTFQEYLLPIVTIEGRTPGEVVRIFERVNSTGMRLSAVDFMRAVTWSEDFDLNREVETMRAAGSKVGFDIPQETLVKILAVVLGHAPTAEAMLGLRALDAAQLKAGIAAGSELLRRAATFFRDELHVRSYALVPYEAQFLAIIGFCKAKGRPSDDRITQVAAWYWAASLSEDMQGRSEHQVARLVERMQGFRKGSVKGLKARLSLTTSALKERRFRLGTALASSLAVMLSMQNRRSLVSGDPIADDEITALGGAAYVGLLDEQQVTDVLGRPIAGGKVVANTIAASAVDLHALRDKTAPQIIADLRRTRPADWIDVLDSQLISEAAAQALLKGRPQDFLEHRANRILALAKKLSVTA